MTCTCRRPRGRGRYCCPAAELAALRHEVDTAVRELDRELAGPRVIDDDGVLRITVKGTVTRLRASRAATAAA